MRKSDNQLPTGALTISSQGSSIGMFECFVERGSAVAISGAGLDRASNCHKQHTHSQGPCRRVFNLYAVLTKGH